MTEQRALHGLRVHIQLLLKHGWQIVSREPLLLRRGGAHLRYHNGMLVSD
ncbi:hypothetical protein [Metapseudomonas furukawaii]|jgi:hypothetical protein|uniref:Uncharacterized protein n=1 Tax=Metapseudomonas furukawaii TaxID=1149133 RepID=L8MG55_METFU|nr:hypothetical protein [Pseudomonas furukawaii]ELS25455.1 hypothetical protein ppKF707_4665 [Pseudomonas furukawaii]ELS29113.1 hypothetical protein ppKF707_4104 [Pseudomonas furukawaii]BAU73893.1 hypothetical protein KF707C_22050 [Pseudomonas furukawaii]